MTAVDIDAAYEVYDRIPLDTPAEWGNLESFRTALHQERRRDEARSL